MTPSSNKLSRRSFIGTTSAFTAGLLIMPRQMLNQDSPVYLIINEAKKSPVVTERLTSKICLLTGSGGNIGVLDGPEGKLMIDAGIDVSSNKIREALSQISRNPLRHLINTHWHFDHTSGNEWLHKEGAKILAHKNTKSNLQKTIRVQEWNYTFPPAPREALPQEVFDKKHQLKINGTNIKLHHFDPAHTDSDICIYFQEEDVLFTGDVWWNGYYPFIDADTKGNIMGMIAAVEHCIANTSDKTIIIPGHGPKGNRKQLELYRDMLKDITEKIKKYKQAGKTLQQVVDLKPTKDHDPTYGNFVISGDWFAKLVYQTL